MLNDENTIVTIPTLVRVDEKNVVMSSLIATCERGIDALIVDIKDALNATEPAGRDVYCAIYNPEANHVEMVFLDDLLEV